MLLPEGFNFLLNCGYLFSQDRLEVRGIAALRDRLSGGSEKLLRKNDGLTQIDIKLTS